jgi:hypothetical protein
VAQTGSVVRMSTRAQLVLLALVLTACSSEVEAEPAAKAGQDEVDISAEALAGPSSERDAKLSPDLEDPFEPNAGETGEGAGETGEAYSVAGLAQHGTARCGGGVSERELQARLDEAEADEPAEPAGDSNEPSPDLSDPFEK